MFKVKLLANTFPAQIPLVLRRSGTATHNLGQYGQTMAGLWLTLESSWKNNGSPNPEQKAKYERFWLDMAPKADHLVRYSKT
jgi:hypothetical protein